MYLGTIYLPTTPGTPVGQFEFISDPTEGTHLEVGTPVAADTAEGTVVGVIIDMRTVGTARDPISADLAAASGASPLSRLEEVVLATVQVFASPKMRPVRAGRVRAATRDELAAATGATKMDWAIPAGLIPLPQGDFAPVHFDGHALLGPESAHLCVGGLSGQAAKTSYIGLLLRSSLAHATQGESVAALVFNVKGEDLIYLDQPPAPGYELSEEDLRMYEHLGVPATPFPDVTVYAPALPAGGGSRSPRQDSLRLAWSLADVWPSLRHLIDPVSWQDEKVQSFLAEFRNYCLYPPNPDNAIDTFDKLEAWFTERLREADEAESQYAWRSHHRTTMWRLKRMLSGLVPRGGGLFTRGKSHPSDDIPSEGWSPGQVVVVDIAGLSTEIQSIVIARTLDRVMRSAEDGRLGVDHLVVVADELNAFAPSHGSEMASVRKSLQRVSTQGRYAGISLWGAGQKLSKVDELVRDNAATRALGILADAELSSGAYGRMPQGLAERIATLPKGWMALSHYSFRSITLVRFPRPAWQTGRARSTQRSRPVTTSVLGLSQRSLDRLTEGVPEETVESLLSQAATPEEAREKLEKVRRPDMHKTALHAPSSFDPDNPFDLT